MHLVANEAKHDKKLDSYGAVRNEKWPRPEKPDSAKVEFRGIIHTLKWKCLYEKK